MPPFSAEELELLDTYEEIASSPELYLDMELEPGDIQLLSNHTQLHARTGYKDAPEPDRKRHLLRLWMSLPMRPTFEYRWRAALSRLSLVKSLVTERVVQRWASSRARLIRPPEGSQPYGPRPGCLALVHQVPDRPKA